MFLPLELLLSFLIRLAHLYSQAGVNKSAFLYILARASEKIGCRKLAASFYRFALDSFSNFNSRKIYNVFQLWEFFSERNKFLIGSSNVVDPLFQAAVKPDMSTRARSRRAAAGYFHAYYTHRGLRIDGFLSPSVSSSHLEFVLNDVVIRRKKTSKSLMGLKVFACTFQRNALAAMLKSNKLSVRLETGEYLLIAGCKEAVIALPQGRAANEPCHILQLDKKGFLQGGSVDVTNLQQGMLDTYEAALIFFEKTLGVSLFLLYGTLLGQYRNQGFIPGDDDFDVGYYSDASSSQAVKEEGMNIVVALVNAGFVVSINRKGRLFRLRLPNSHPSCHLDVHAVWRESGSLWIHPRANLNCDRSVFLPATPAEFCSRKVLVPADPEVFLEAYYGKNWKTPDPAYTTDAKPFSLYQSEQLEKAFVNPVDLRSMISKIDGDKRQCLIAIGIQSIYPLEDYEKNCDW